MQGHVIDQLFLVDDGQSTWIHLEKERVAPVIEYLNKMKFMSIGRILKLRFNRRQTEIKFPAPRRRRRFKT